MILLIIIPVYISLNLYILHRVHKWLTACSERFHSRKFAVPYIVIYSLLALSLLFAFLLPSSELQVLVKRISNYWLGNFCIHSDIYCSCRYPAAGTEENTGENT